jgi:methylenetetrahydrofolate--tRNA-(uracil-5-)-methyltransferase
LDRTAAHNGVGALLAHITGDAEADTYQPMNINFGLFPPIITEKKIKKAGRKLVYTERAKGDLAPWVSTIV